MSLVFTPTPTCHGAPQKWKKEENESRNLEVSFTRLFISALRWILIITAKQMCPNMSRDLWQNKKKHIFCLLIMMFSFILSEVWIEECKPASEEKQRRWQRWVKDRQLNPVHADHNQNLSKNVPNVLKLKNCSWFPFYFLLTNQSLEAAAAAVTVPQLQEKLTKEDVWRAETLRGRSRTKKKRRRDCATAAAVTTVADRKCRTDESLAPVCEWATDPLQHTPAESWKPAAIHKTQQNQKSEKKEKRKERREDGGRKKDRR